MFSPDRKASKTVFSAMGRWEHGIPPASQPWANKDVSVESSGNIVHLPYTPADHLCVNSWPNNARCLSRVVSVACCFLLLSWQGVYEIATLVRKGSGCDHDSFLYSVEVGHLSMRFPLLSRANALAEAYFSQLWS